MEKKWELDGKIAAIFMESNASCTGCIDYDYLINREDYIKCSSSGKYVPESC